MNLITCTNLTLSYEANPVVQDLSFSVEEGSLLYIIGRNGSGKSTLAKAMLGLHPIEHGSIVFDKSITKRNIGYMPQKTPAQQNFPASVWEVVLSGFCDKMRLLPIYTAKEKAVAEDNLRLLSVSDLKKRSYRELSGGQQQRVLLARALCAADRILILDEPTAALDPQATIEFHNAILHLNREVGVTILMISHDLDAARKYASHILLLDHNGSFFGTTEEYLKSEAAKSFGKERRNANT